MENIGNQATNHCEVVRYPVTGVPCKLNRIDLALCNGIIHILGLYTLESDF